MSSHAKRIFALVLPLLTISLLSGCTNYEKMYKALNVEHKNLVGLYENCQAEKANLAQNLSSSQAQIDELQKQITQQHKTPAQATGFEGMQVDINGAEGTITVTLDNAILFDAGSATLKGSSNGTLDKILSVIKSKYPGKIVDVVGHTDSDPIQKSKWKDNWELSAERALSVVRYLQSHDLSKDHLRAIGCGDSRPVTSNATAAGKAKNRRVQIVVHVK
jgi:chemotaxis protein MotB